MDDLAHVLAVIDLNNQRYEDRFAAQEKAIGVAETNSEKWRNNANEWRAAMGDRETKFASQAELDILIKALAERIAKLELAQADNAGRSTGLSSGWAILVTVVALGVTILNLYIGLST